MGAKIYTKAERAAQKLKAAKPSHALQKHAPAPKARNKPDAKAPSDAEQRAIATLGDANRMLAMVCDAPTAKRAIDIATAAEFYARKAKMGDAAIAHATRIKLGAKRMLGTYINALPEAKRGPKADVEIISTGDNKSRLDAYKEIGITPALAAEAQRLVDIPDEEWARVESGEIKPSVALRNVKRSTLSDRIASLPAGKYRVIYADPPWKYGDERQGLEKEGTAAAAQYPTMPTSKICEFADHTGRPVSDLADKDAVLFMWATFPLLDDALNVIRAWKFDYKTAIVWDKQRSNIGNYHDARCELLMICVRGSCPIEIDTRVKQVQSIQRSEHSRKPEEFRQLIDSLYPSGPRVELFRRGVAPDGWVIWGNESEVAA